MWREVSAGSLPWRIDLYAFPGSTVVFHPSPLMEALSLPLTAAFGVVTSYNLLLIASFAATGYATFLLAWRVSGSALVGLAGGAMFTGTAPHQFDLLFNTNAVWALPLVWLAFLEWREKPGRWPLVAVTSIALGLSNFYFAAYFLLPSFLVFAPWRRLRDTRVVTSYAAAAASVIAALALVYVPSLVAAGKGTRDQLNAAASDVGSRPPTEVLALFTGSPNNPLLGDLFGRMASGLDPSQAPNTGSVYIGLVVLVLAVVGLRRGLRKGPWLVLAAIGAVMALGPELQVGGHRLIPMPYAIAEHVPILSYLRAPGRFYALMALALILLACCGLQAVRERAGRAGPAAVVALACLAVIDSLFRFPVPTTPVPVPEIYARLGDLPGHAAVIEAPGGGFNDYEWLAMQRESGLPIVNDAGVRTTTLRDLPLYRNPFLAGTVAGPLPSVLSAPPATAAERRRLDAARRAGVRQLAREGVGYAILHTHTTFGWPDPSNPGFALYRDYLQRYLGPPAYEDEDVVLFTLPGAPGADEIRSWASPASRTGTPAAPVAAR